MSLPQDDAKNESLSTAEASAILKESKLKAKAKKPAKKKMVFKMNEAAAKSAPIEKKSPAPTFVFENKPTRKSSGGSLKGGLVFLVIVLLAIGGYVLFDQSKKFGQAGKDIAENVRQEVGGQVASLSDQLALLSKQVEEDKQKNEVKMSQYTNADLGLQFSYPAELGDVQPHLQDDDPKTADDQVLTLTFSANPDVWLVAAGKSYKKHQAGVYNGSIDDFAKDCPKLLEITDDGYCDIRSLMQAQLEESVQAVRGDDQSLLNVVKTLQLNIIKPPFHGLTVNVGLGLPPVTGRSLFAPTSDDVRQEALQSFYRQLIKKEGLSLVVQQNLKAYEAIVTSLQPIGSGS